MAKVRHEILGDVYAPNSLAVFYYANTNRESPQGLYTDQYGFIHNGDPHRDLTKDLESGQRVFIFGGSSVAGQYSTTSNRRTIAAFMEEFLNAAPAAETQVVNAGIDSYESLRELMRAVDLMARFDMDTLVFLDGRNDFIRLTASNEFVPNYFPWQLKHIQCDADLSEQNFFSRTLRRSSTWRLASRIKHLGGNESQGPPVLNAVYGDGQNPAQVEVVDPDALFTPDCFGFALRRELTYRPEALTNYVNNLRSIAGICVGQQKRCIIALQPVLGYGSRSLTSAEALFASKMPFENYFAVEAEFFDRARVEFQELSREFQDANVQFIDLTQVFNDVPQRVFLDSVHYLDYGNCILGAALAAQITLGDWTQGAQHRRTCDALER
jgi:hypothetical protein